MSNNWVDQLPLYPLSDLLVDYLKDSDKFGNMPGQPVNISTYYEALRQRIVRTNCEIIDTKNRDDVAAAETRLKLFKGELEKMENGLRRGIIERLLRSIYACAGHLNGKRVIVPAQAWSGHVDWENETLTFENRPYTRLRTIVFSRLTLEQKERVRKYLLGELDDSPEEDRPPGKPNRMHFVRREFARRKEAKLVKKPLKAEAECLAAWFEREHPEKEPLQVKTITNKLRNDYNAYMSEIEKTP